MNRRRGRGRVFNFFKKSFISCFIYLIVYLTDFYSYGLDFNYDAFLWIISMVFSSIKLDIIIDVLINNIKLFFKRVILNILNDNDLSKSIDGFQKLEKIRDRSFIPFALFIILFACFSYSIIILAIYENSSNY